MFSEAQSMPCIEADVVAGYDNWAGTDTKAKLNSAVY